MSDNQPLISIITVTFNAAETIRDTLISVDKQSFKDYEHLIIDGKSTDRTIEIARESDNPRLRIVSEKDNGLYDAMNKGLRLAKGKYLLFLNSGDRFHSPETLDKYAEFANRDFDIIYGDTDIVNKNGCFLRHRHLSAPSHLTTHSFENGMLICHQAFMVKKIIAPEYDTNYRFSSDYDWCIKCIAASIPERTKNIDCVAIDYLDEGLTSKNKWKSLRERYCIMKKNYGGYRTLLNHFKFLGRALKRKSL